MSASKGSPLGRRVARRLCTLGVVTAAIGCAGQSEHYDDHDWTKEHGLQSGAWREAETLFAEGESDVDRYDRSLQGVRHDLRLLPGAAPTTRCSCLDVAVGTPNDPRFSWAGKRPSIDPDSLVVAFQTEGTACSASDERRPSIQAVDVRGDDVIVVIEELDWERPQVLGAIVSKPGGKGHLWIRPAKKTLPYARATAGADRCRVTTEPHKHHKQYQSGRRQ